MRTLRWQGVELRIAERVLSNGLRVLVHEDRSAPMVSVHVGYHVGSAREPEGRTGFAHLFEHLLFEGSRHVPKGGHFRFVTEAGGALNGSTSHDRTAYFETLPSNQLELALWLESDRMGFFLPAMTQAKLDNQRDVVRNERRQNYELRPYAKAREQLAAALHPASHPYAHLPIGSHRDLEAATLADVTAFFEHWYGPNNAVLAIGGDVDSERAFERAEHWFGEIPRGPEVLPARPQPFHSGGEQRLSIEDKVQLPQLTLAWPVPYGSHADAPALAMLAMVLSASRASILDRALTIEALLARSVGCGLAARELAGQMTITITAAVGVGLEQLEARTRELLAKLVQSGADANLLARMKTRLEFGFSSRLEQLTERTSELMEARLLRGDAGEFVAEIERALAVTPGEVRDACERYLVAQPALVLSVVPESARANGAAR